MQNKLIVRFNKDNLFDFRDYILPNVFQQLLLAENHDEMQVVCAGAVVDGKPAGAAIAQLLEEGEIYLYSIMVDQDARREHIATDMLNGILSEAFAEYVEDSDIATAPLRVFIHTEYVLAKEDAEGFDAFLKKFGFSDFHEMEHCCYFESKRLVAPDGFTQPANIISFAADAKGHEDELSRFLLGKGMDIEAKNAFMLTEGDDVKAVISAEYGIDGEYFVRCIAEDELRDEEFSALFWSLVTSLAKDASDFDLVMDLHEIANQDFMEQLAEQKGEIYFHKEAGYYGEFNPEEG